MSEEKKDENIEENEKVKKGNRFKNFVYSKFGKIFLILLLDIAFATAAFVIARSIAFNVQVDLLPTPETLESYFQFEVLIGIAFIGITVLMLALLDSYSTIWRYAGRVEFFKIIIAYLASTGLIFLFSFLMHRVFGVVILTQIVLVYVIFSLFFSAAFRYNYGIRSYIVSLKNRIRTSRRRKKAGISKGMPLLRTVIIGAGYTGGLFINRSFNNPDEGYLPVAVVDDEKEKFNQKIYGVRVEGGLENLEQVIKKFRAEAIVIAISKISKVRLKEIFLSCAKFNIPIKLSSMIKDALESDTEYKTLELNEIRIEELLGREEFAVKRELLDESIKDKIVLVTGGAGSIGSELCRQALAFGCRHLVIFDNHENGMFELAGEFKAKFDTERFSLVIGSVRDKPRLEEVFKRFSIQVVFHAAAYKHVPIMEFSSSEAIKNNVFGTLNTIEVAEKFDAERFIFISTDKAVNPANVMGASKRIAEMLVQTKGAKSKMRLAAVRFGNVLGSNGSVIPIFLKQIKEGGPITLTDRNIKRYFMTIPEAVRLVLQAGSLAQNGDVFVLDMGEPVYIYDLACDLIKINGLEPEVDIKIVITGLRDGEKMFEELKYCDESVDKTTHEGIFITKMEPIDNAKFTKNLERLKKAADGALQEKLTDTIFQIVPSEYRSEVGK